MTQAAGRLEPVAPILVADSFDGLGRELVALLGSLAPEQWRLPTVCSRWSVKDVAAHLLDTACRQLSTGRDGFSLPAPDRPLNGFRDLVDLLDDLNARWVTAAQRLSPRLLTDLLAFVEPQLARYLGSLDPWARALFPVAWAGEEESQTWFDVARELTERWHHQQQIRLAVGAPPLDDPGLSGPVFETFLRALPHRYRGVEAPPGTTVSVRIEGREAYVYALRRTTANGGEGAGWELLRGEAEAPAAAIRLDEETAWLALTKGIPPGEARRRARVGGDPNLAAPYFDAVAVMA